MSTLMSGAGMEGGEGGGGGSGGREERQEAGRGFILKHKRFDVR